ncbi:Alpha/Beta hydrolase protein, partial [Chytriomyces sp. MP71]
MPTPKVLAVRKGTHKHPPEEYDHSGSYFTSPVDGEEIYYQIWKPKEGVEAKAVVLSFHGLGMHASYENVLHEAFAKAGIVVKALDYRGHGWTVLRNQAGLKGYHKSFEAIWTDMDCLLGLNDQVDTSNLPVFTWGGSLGGLLSTLYPFYNKVPNFSGVIAMCPAYSSDQLWYLRFVAVTIGDVVPRFTPPVEAVDGDSLCSHEPTNLAILESPLCHNQVSAKLGKDIITWGARLRHDASKFTYPILVAHGVADTITSPMASKKFAAECASTDKEYKAVGEGALHIMLGEPAVKDKLI